MAQMAQMVTTLPRRNRPLALLALACGTAVLSAFGPAAGRLAAGQQEPLTARITSPLGRTGVVATVRIVAQIQSATADSLLPVRFFVDNVLVGTDSDGPPYAVEWMDENPFEPRELAVEVGDAAGHHTRATLQLPAFEVTEVTEVRSILLEASVYDHQGRYVSQLPTDAFTVFEGGAPQKIDLVSPEKIPATFGLLVDSSQSMARRMDFVRNASARLLDLLGPADRLLLAPFTTTVGSVTGPTDDRATVAEGIDVIQAGGGTAILDSLKRGIEMLATFDGRRAIVLVTDGYDENSTVSIDQIFEAAREAQVTIYVVGIGGVSGMSLKGQQLLRRLADVTGGRFFFPRRDTELTDVCARVGADAHNRYLITYTPANQLADGSWRAVEVRATDAYVVKTRDGYYAPKPAPIRPSLEFTVSDPARGLVEIGAADVAVFEDGAEQTVDTFQEAVSPLSIVLAIDSSGSMKKAAPVVMETAADFVLAVRPEDSLALITFADKSRFAHVLATNRQWSLDAIAKYKADGGTALYDALHDSLMTLADVRGRRVVVVVTDGRDEDNPGTGPGSVHTADEVLDLIKKTGAMVFGIGVGPKVDRTFLTRIARASGGDAYFPDDAPALQGEYRRIVENLRKRFVLSYTSTNTARDGSWRQVEIQSKSRNLVVKSQGGYFAPSR